MRHFTEQEIENISNKLKGIYIYINDYNAKQMLNEVLEQLNS